MKSYIGIEDIFAHEILDSRGIPTIETEVYIQMTETSDEPQCRQ